MYQDVESGIFISQFSHEDDVSRTDVTVYFWERVNLRPSYNLQTPILNEKWAILFWLQKVKRFEIFLNNLKPTIKDSYWNAECCKVIFIILWTEYLWLYLLSLYRLCFSTITCQAPKNSEVRQKCKSGPPGQQVL